MNITFINNQFRVIHCRHVYTGCVVDGRVIWDGLIPIFIKESDVLRQYKAR